MMPRPILPTAALALAALLGAVMPAAAREAGVAAAVMPRTTGEPPAAGMRTLTVGLDVMVDERIVTSDVGRTQLLFLDGSALTIGPNAEVVLDEFVYDPDAKAGKITLSATKGVFRFVGGRISKRTPVVLRTPSATIGVRGGIAIIEVGAETTATFLFGDELTMTAGSETRSITKPGFAVSAAAPEAPPSKPVAVRGDGLKQVIGSFEGISGVDAGAPEPPRDEDVARTQITGLGSLRAPEKPPAAGGGEGQGGEGRGDGRERRPGDRNAERLPVQLGDFGFANVAQESQQQAMLQQTTTQLAGGPFAGRLRAELPGDGVPGASNQGGAADTGFVGGRIESGRFRALVGGSLFDVPVGGPDSVVPFSGNSQSAAGALAGTSRRSLDGDFVVVEAAPLGDPARRQVLFAGVPTPPSRVPTGGTTEFALSRDFVLDSELPFFPAGLQGPIPDLTESLTAEAGGIFWDVSGSPEAQRPLILGFGFANGGGTQQNSAFGVIVGQIRLAPDGRPFVSAHMRGTSRSQSSAGSLFYSAPVSSVQAGDGSHFFGSQGPNALALQAGTVTAAGQATGSIARAVSPDGGVTVYRPLVTASVTPENGPPEGTRASGSFRGFAAGVMESFDADGIRVGVGRMLTTDGNPSNVSVTKNAATNKLTARFDVRNVDLMSDRTIVRFGDENGGSGRSGYITDRAFAAVESGSPATIDGLAVGTSAYLISGADEDGFESLATQGVQFCQCDGLSLGFWGAELAFTGGRNRLHLAMFVTGDLASPGQIAALAGSASYTGHLIGTVTDAMAGPSGPVRVAAGSYQQSYDFATRSGSVQIVEFDGVDYSGSVTAGTGQEHRFSGPINSLSGPTRFGLVEGAFFRGQGGASSHVGGQFGIVQSGGGYEAVGIFAADRQ